MLSSLVFPVRFSFCWHPLAQDQAATKMKTMPDAIFAESQNVTEVKCFAMTSSNQMRQGHMSKFWNLKGTWSLHGSCKTGPANAYPALQGHRDSGFLQISPDQRNKIKKDRVPYISLQPMLEGSGKVEHPPPILSDKIGLVHPS